MAKVSGRSKFWVIATPLLAAIVLLTVMHVSVLTQPTAVVGSAQDQSITHVWAVLLIAFFGVALWGYAVMCFFRSNSTDRDQIERVMAQATTGDLTGSSGSTGVDSIGNFGRQFDLVTRRMSEMVANIRSAAVQLGDTGKKLVDDTRSLAERAQAQGEHLTQTAMHVRRVSETVSRNAEASQEVIATGAGSHRRVEREQTRLQLLNRVVAHRAGKLRIE